MSKNKKYGELYYNLIEAKEGNSDSINYILKRFDSFIIDKMNYYNIVDKESCYSEVYNVIWKCIKLFKI